MAKVLIIDDDPDVRTLMQILLSKNGYEIDTASRKEEVMDKIEKFAPAIILLDVLLSGSDGRELCKEIKHKYREAGIKVIMISAHPSASDKIANYGADDFISKPVNAQILLDKLMHFRATKTAREA